MKRIVVAILSFVLCACSSLHDAATDLNSQHSEVEAQVSVLSCVFAHAVKGSEDSQTRTAYLSMKEAHEAWSEAQSRAATLVNLAADLEQAGEDAPIEEALKAAEEAREAYKAFLKARNAFITSSETLRDVLERCAR